MAGTSTAVPFAQSTGSLLTDTPNPVTARFRASLAAKLQPISPELAAFQVTRARVFKEAQGGPTPLSCSRCGTLPCSVRLVRPKCPNRGEEGKKGAQLMQGHERAEGRRGSIERRCKGCGFKDTLPLQVTSKAIPGRGSFPMVRRRGSAPNLHAQPAPPAPGSHIASSLTTPPQSITPVGAKPSPKLSIGQPVSKEASGSQCMLGRPSGKTKSRQKMASGLQEMLARDRAKQTQELKGSKGSNALAGFLGTLE